MHLRHCQRITKTDTGNTGPRRQQFVARGHREAEDSRIQVGAPQYVTGEKDWVYGIVARGKNLSAGDSVPLDVMVSLQVGNGQINDEEELLVTDHEPEETMEEEVIMTEEDPFEEIVE